jgi:TP901 family phage tail tape measure protein
MAGDTNSNIFINIDTSQAMTQLRALEKELTALNRSLIVGTKAAAQAQAKYAQSLLHNVNATGQWSASMTRMSTASEQFATNLDRQRLSLKEYFRYGMASTKTFGKFFGREFDTVGKLVDKRVKTLQQQYVQLGRDAQGAMNAMKFTPKSLNYKDVTTRLMMATQRQQIFNKLIDDGATKLLNFGKNTQWAGRQLMVGFTIPLMLFGSQAIKVFKEIETQTIRFKKVYGDIFTDQGATDVALKNIRALGDEYTKYGLKVSDTIKMAADAAAAGFSGKGLEGLVEQTNKLAVLGGVTQEKALETTIALKNAFQIDTGQMAGTIDFLNAVENQTVVALDDLTEAIPKVAPVVQQLGGDVKDLAFFMAAMQEGGISAAQGANALKSGLASLINPSKAASKAAAAVGININGIIEANQGNLRNTVIAFAKSLQPLTDLEKSRVIEKVFGKYQFARISALLNNVSREGTQAARVLQLTNASVEELAILSQRELKTQADSPMNKLAAAVEKLKVSIAPIGELFAKVFTPVIEFIARMAEKFNNLPDGIKKAIGIITVVVGGLGPIFLMTFGLLANAVANSVKGVQILRKGYQQLAAGSSDAALKTQYLSQEELENISISNALYAKHQQLSAAYTLESTALTSLMSTYTRATAAMGSFAATNPGMFMPRGGVLLPKKFAGGTTSVPGPKGAGDVIPAMLSPGESVIPVKQTQKYSGFINQIIQDKVPGFMAGRLGAMPAVARPASTRGVVGAKAPVIPITATPISSSLPGIRYAQEGDKVRIFAGDTSFLIPLKDISTFKVKLQENESWMKSPIHGSGNKNVRKDNTEQALIKAITRPLSGGKKPSLLEQSEIIKPADIYSRLPKAGAQRKSNQNQDIANKRFKALMKAKNPHLIKLQNYLQNEEKVYLERVLGPDIVQSLKGFDANKLTPSHIREVRSQNRTPEDWAPNKIARDWGWFNSALRGTKFGKVKGGHPVNAAQARELLDNLKMTPFESLPNDKKALQTVLEYRLNRQPSYYDDFRFIDNAMMKVAPVPLAGGVVSLGMPIPFKKVQAQRAMAEKIDAQIKESRFKNLPVTDTGTKIQKLGGFSVGSISRAVNGVYQLPNGRTVVYKAVESEEAALAEMRMSALMRKGSELGTPSNQSIKVIADPTDLSKQRKVLVIESDYNPRFANPTGEFTPKQFIKQTLASGIRGDKDLKTDNVSGNDVIDMSNAGVFATASNRNKYADSMKSVEEQLLINFGAVKGGASKDFAKSVQAIAAEMGPTKFKNLMIKEIEESIPRYKATIETFKLNPKEREMYDAIVARLEDAKKADWKKIYNAAVGDIPAYANGIVSVPGPKGAGDIQPAMLSPGEAVIPAKQSEKYMPLIRSMIADNVPGYAESNVEWDGSPRSLRPGGKYSGPVTPPGVDSWGDPVRPPATSGTRLRNAITSVVRDKDINAVKNFTKETAKAAKESKVAGRAMEGVKKTAARVSASFTDTEKAAKGTTSAFGTDKTRGFRGFLTGYGSVSQTVTNEDGTKRLASAAERTNMRQDRRMQNVQRMMPAQMLGMMIPMAAQGYATKNPDSGIAKSMDLIMLVSMLVMLLPLLQSPLAMLAATAVGLVAVFKMQAATIKKNIIEGQNQAKSMSMTTEKLEQLGAITQKVSTTQTAQAKRDSRVTEIVPVSMDFGKNIIANSDFGKELKTSFEKTMNDIGRGPAVESLVSQLGTAVSQNVLTQEQAESIAVALTRNLKDASLELNVRGRLIQLFGPDGQNILNNPLQVQVDILTSGSSMQKTAMKNLQDVIAQERNRLLGTGVSGGEAIQLGGGLLAGGATGAYLGSKAANAMSIASMGDDAAKAATVGRALNFVRGARVASMGAAAAGAPVAGVGAIPGLIATAVTGAFEIGIRQWQRGKEKAAIGKAAGLVSGLASENLKASQQSIDSVNAQYASALENLRIKKQIAKTEADKAKVDEEILAMESKREGAQTKLKTMQADILKNVETQFESVGKERWTEQLPGGSGRGGDRDKVMEAFKISMQEKFKGSALAAEATLLQSQLDRMENDTATLKIQTLVTSDVLSPGEASALVSTLTATGKDISKTIDTIVRTQGTEGLDRLSTILTFLPNEDNRKNLLLKVSNMSDKDAAATYTALEELLKIPDYIGISIDMETDPDDIKDLKKTGTEIERLKKLFPNGEISYTALIKAQKDEGGPGKNIALDKAIEQWGALSALPKNLQFQAMITMGTMDISDSVNAGINRDLKSAAMKDLGIAPRPGTGTSGAGFVPDLGSISDKQYKDWAAKNADKVKKITSDYWKKTMQDIFGIAPTDTSKDGNKTGSGDGATLDLSWANDLVQKLKLVKEGSLNALKPLESLQKFLGKGNAATKNPMLDDQLGKLKQLEQQAVATKTSLATNLLGLLTGLDPEQFALVYKYLFNIDGTLNDIGKIYNEAFKVETVGSYLQGQKEANKSLESQIQTFNKLTDAGYKTDQIIKILEDDTLALDLANGGAFSKEELEQFNAELAKTLKLNQQIAQQKLGFAINDLEKQVDAYNKLNEAGVKQEVILEILKDKANVLAIANSPGKIAEQYGPLIDQTKTYLDLLKTIAEQTKTFEQKTQDAIDANVTALDLQARELQNQFDIDNFELKAKIKLAEDAVEGINKQIQSEQDKIDDINFKLKYDPNIGQNLLDDLQEQVSDLQRSMEIAFDRPIQALQDRSTILSNDLTLIDKAAEAINEKYDKQEEALSKISQLNQDIATQEKNRISLADALSQGDISAAAQMANEMRSTAAESANRLSGDYLATARKSEIDSLVSASGMTKEQIQAEQFRIEQQVFALEQQRKITQQQIVDIEDRIYNITELREAKLLDIRNIEQTIDGLKNNQLRAAQGILDGLQKELEKNQAILDAKLLAIEKEKLGWEKVQIQLDNYNAKLKQGNDELRTTLDLLESIKKAMAEMASFNSSNLNSSSLSGGLGGSAYIAPKDTPESIAAFEEFIEIVQTLDAAAELVDAAKAALDAGTGGGQRADAEYARLVAELAAAEALLKAAQEAYDATLPKLDPNYIGGGGGGGGWTDAMAMSSGGMVPKYFGTGGKSIGSDTVPAMLTPGEFVMNRSATKAFGPMLAAMNGSKFPSMLQNGFTAPTYQTSSTNIIAPSNVSNSSSVNNNSSSVYNYNVGISVNGSNLNPQDVARAVMTQIKGVDSQRIRTQR